MVFIGIFLIFLLGLVSWYVYNYFSFYEYTYKIILVYFMIFILGSFAGLIGIYFKINSILTLIVYVFGYITPLFLIYKK